jgi:hypothetical protein
MPILERSDACPTYRQIDRGPTQLATPLDAYDFDDASKILPPLIAARFPLPTA